MHASASQLALVLLLIGWKGGANLLSQSHRVESAKPITFRHSNENRSNRPYLKGGHVFPFPSAKVKGQINVHFSLRSQQQRVWWIHHESTVNQEKALCLHCQLVSCFSDFFWLCGKSLLSCESISTHCLAPRETVRVRGSRDNVSPEGVNEFWLVARDIFFVQPKNAENNGRCNSLLFFYWGIYWFVRARILGLAIFLRVFLFFLFIDISVSNGVLFELNSFLLTSRVNMGKQIYQGTVKDL